MQAFQANDLLSPTVMKGHLRNLIDELLIGKRLRDLTREVDEIAAEVAARQERSQQLDDEAEFIDEPEYAWAEAWDAMDDGERSEIIDTYDDLDAQGRLGDVPFYDQWIALHRKSA